MGPRPKQRTQETVSTVIRMSRSRAILLASLLLTLALVGLFFEPEIISTYWHLRFGNFTTFHGWRIPVPKGWWAFTKEDQLIIQKMRRFYDRRDPAGIIVGTLTPSRPVKPEALKEASIQVNSKKGYALKEDRPFSIGSGTGYCLHFSALKDEKLIHITCDSLSAGLSLDLYGRPSDIQPFYSVVSQIADFGTQTH